MRNFKYIFFITLIIFSACKRDKDEGYEKETQFSISATNEDATSTVNDINDGGFPIASRYIGGYFVYNTTSDSIGNCFTRKRMGTDNDSDRIYIADTLIFNNCSGSKTFIIQDGPLAGNTAKIDWNLNGQIVRSDINDNDPYVFNIVRGTPDFFRTNIKLYLNGSLVSNKTHYSKLELSTAHQGNLMNFTISRIINTINEFNDCQRNWTVSGNGYVDFSNGQGWHPGKYLPYNGELYIVYNKSGNFISCSGKKYYVFIKTEPNLVIKGSCRRADGSLKIYSGKIVKTITDSISFTKNITIQWNNCQENPSINQ